MKILGPNSVNIRTLKIMARDFAVFEKSDGPLVLIDSDTVVTGLIDIAKRVIPIGHRLLHNLEHQMVWLDRGSISPYEIESSISTRFLCGDDPCLVDVWASVYISSEEYMAGTPDEDFPKTLEWIESVKSEFRYWTEVQLEMHEAGAALETDPPGVCLPELPTKRHKHDEAGKPLLISAAK